MRLIFSLLAGFLLCGACNKTNTEPILDKSSNTEMVAVIIDLEDYIYKVNGAWHRMDEPFEDCNPFFKISYSYTNKQIQITYCESKGVLDLHHIDFELNHCSPEIIRQESQTKEGVVDASIWMSDAFNVCLIDEDDFFTLHLPFEFND